MQRCRPSSGNSYPTSHASARASEAPPGSAPSAARRGPSALASILTGTDTRGHGAGVSADGKLQAINTEAVTLRQALGRAGYGTAAVTTNAWLAGGLGFERSFDAFWHADADFHHRLLLMGWPEGPKAHEGEAVVDRALRVLDELPDDGWFLRARPPPALLPCEGRRGLVGRAPALWDAARRSQAHAGP